MEMARALRLKSLTTASFVKPEGVPTEFERVRHRSKKDLMKSMAAIFSGVQGGDGLSNYRHGTRAGCLTSRPSVMQNLPFSNQAIVVACSLATPIMRSDHARRLPRNWKG